MAVQQRLYHRICTAIPGGLTVFVILCSCFFSGCGTPSSDKPLVGRSTVSIQASPTTGAATPDRGIAPIKVIDTQTNLISYPGEHMSLTISTSPFAVCSFVVYYGLSKPSRTTGIVPRTADANGMVNWTWSVDKNAHTGTWPLTISAVLANGAKTSMDVHVNVTLAPISIIGGQSRLSALPGKRMTLMISTAPFVLCTIQYQFGPGRPVKTLTIQANSHGVVIFQWFVGTHDLAGTWTVAITATLMDGESSTSQVNVMVL